MANCWHHHRATYSKGMILQGMLGKTESFSNDWSNDSDYELRHTWTVEAVPQPTPNDMATGEKNHRRSSYLLGKSSHGRITWTYQLHPESGDRNPNQIGVPIILHVIRHEITSTWTWANIRITSNTKTGIGASNQIQWKGFQSVIWLWI